MKLYEIKRQSPRFMIVEAADKNVHLEHVEDLIFNLGYNGAEAAIAYLEDLRVMLAEGTGTTNKITVKWDGSPAVVCGIDPTDGKFFVGTKSVFAKTEPKLIKTSRDVEKFYSETPELAQILAQALKHLPKLNIGTVLQGDLMFLENTITTDNINNQQCYTFTPNTITYAVPVDSELGQKIAKAKIGIIFHTQYEGESVANMTAKFGATVEGLTKTPDVWFDDATYKDYTGIASLTPKENKDIINHISAAIKTINKIGAERFNVIVDNKEFSQRIKPFINKMIRGGEQVGDPTQFLKKFVEEYRQEQENAIASLKSGPESRAAQNRLQKIQEKEQWMADNANNLLGVLAVYKRVIEIKNKLLNKLQTVEGIATFQKTNDGYRVISPEGFVAIGHDGGAVKLVDRLEFSRSNFLKRMM